MSGKPSGLLRNGTHRGHNWHTSRHNGTRSREPIMRAMPDNQQRTAVLIAGMHRSGTSALAHTLGLAGCDLPKTLMEPRLNTSERSLKGHSESWPITLLNVEILSSVNHHGFEEVNLHFGNSNLDTQFSERAVMALQSEFSDSDLFVLKDPRLCLLMQFWIDAVRAFGARAVVICPIRNPLEVISSLKARSKTDRRSHKFLLLHWLRYVLSAEASSRNIPRTFTRYNDLLDNPLTVLWESADALDVTWPRSPHRRWKKIFATLYRRHIDITEPRRKTFAQTRNADSRSSWCSIFSTAGRRVTFARVTQPNWIG